MPELPEVETIARTLAPNVEGKSLLRIEVLNPGTWQGNMTPGQFNQQGPYTALSPARRAKVLLLDMRASRNNVPEQNRITGLAFHLKMTGRLFAYPANTRPGNHTRAVLHLDDGSLLFFDDTRKFGYIRPISEDELAAWSFWQALGPEPLLIGEQEFVRLFAGKKGAIKGLLLDQTVIVGIGNIYADESLFRAGIRPDSSAGKVAEKQLVRLHKELQAILREAIAACGSSIRDYRTAQGDAGSFQNSFNVYGRSGQACPACGYTLEKIKVAGRSTVFCPKCQNKPD